MRVGPKIDHDIPIPPARTEGHWKDLAGAMAIGDSVFVANRREAACLLHAINKAHGLKSGMMRTKSTGVRVWRKK